MHRKNIDSLNNEVADRKTNLLKEFDATIKEYKMEIKKLNKEMNLKDESISKLKKEFKNIPSTKCAKTQTISDSNSVIIQTESHTDIPYLITEALFSKVLRKKTPKLAFLSNSLPDLDKICVGASLNRTFNTLKKTSWKQHEGRRP